MADVEFFEVGDGEDFVDVLVVETVAGVDTEAELVTEGGTLDQAVEFMDACLAGGIGEGAGVELDAFGFEVGGGVDLVRIGIDKETDDYTIGLELADGGRKGGAVRDAIESALGGDLVPVFGDEAGVVGLDLERDGEDFGRVAYLEIQLGGEALFELEDIAVLHVATVFAEVGGDAVGARPLGNEGGFDRIGFDEDAVRVTRIARLPQSRGVVDVDAEAEWHSQTLPP